MKHIELQRVAPADIEARSMELIGQELGERVFPAEQLPVVKRVIHTTADFEYADSLVFSAGAVEAGVAAIRQGCTIVTDTQMAFSGVNKRVLEKFGGRAVCFVNVVESKELLLTLDVPYIVARGRKGGSNVAAAICNAMLYQASNNARE